MTGYWVGLGTGFLLGAQVTLLWMGLSMVFHPVDPRYLGKFLVMLSIIALFLILIAMGVAKWALGI